jgi:DNA-binding MarR family transcriptional regulator
MPNSPQAGEPENGRIILGLLESVEQNGAQSQRHLAAELDIALGLVNAYLKRCIQKGLVKVSQAPARRFAYYLTPHGFAEKSRLSLEYLTYSFTFFRQAKSDCFAVFEEAKKRGFRRVALAGVSDLAEIATICARESGVEITVVIDPQSSLERFLGLPIRPDLGTDLTEFDAIIVTDLKDTRHRADAAVAQFGTERVLVPSLLRHVSKRQEPTA